MSDHATRLLMSLMASAFFGYSAVNSLVFYRRTRDRVAQYKDRPLAGMVRSPQYNWTIWLSGIVGVIGFAIASWQAVINALALLHGR